MNNDNNLELAQALQRLESVFSFGELERTNVKVLRQFDVSRISASSGSADVNESESSMSSNSNSVLSKSKRSSVYLAPRAVVREVIQKFRARKAELEEMRKALWEANRDPFAYYDSNLSVDGGIWVRFRIGRFKRREGLDSKKFDSLLSIGKEFDRQMFSSGKPESLLTESLETYGFVHLRYGDYIDEPLPTPLMPPFPPAKLARLGLQNCFDCGSDVLTKMYGTLSRISCGFGDSSMRSNVVGNVFFSDLSSYTADPDRVNGNIKDLTKIRKDIAE